MAERILVVGGTRFVGRLLVWRLLARGDRVTLFHRGTHEDPFGERVERVRGDRTTADLDRLRGREFDAAIDFAAYDAPDVARAIDVLDGRVGRYLFVSTGQVYLVRRDVPSPAREDDYGDASSLRPRPEGDDAAEWDYGIGKRAAEDRLAEAWASRRFPSIRLRIPMVNGPRDPYRRIERYVHRLLDGGPLLLPHAERSVRHVDAQEVAKTILALLAEPRAIGEAWNQAQDETPTLRDVVAAIGRELGASSRLVDVDRARMEAHGLDVRAASPFSRRWMSFLDPSRVRALGIDHAPLDRTLAVAVGELLAHLPTPPEDYRAQRAREIALADAIA